MMGPSSNRSSLQVDRSRGASQTSCQLLDAPDPSSIISFAHPWKLLAGWKANFTVPEIVGDAAPATQLR